MGYSLVAALSNPQSPISERLCVFARELADVLGGVRVSVKVMNGINFEAISSSPSFDARAVVEQQSFKIMAGGDVFGVLGVEASRQLTATESDFLRSIPALIGQAVQGSEEKEKLLRLAYTDELTGLPNRRAFMQEAPKRLEATRRATTRSGSLPRLCRGSPKAA